MRSDGWMLRYLLNRNAPAGSWARRDLAFWFDWTDDYISSNATIGRTGYDMNVSWNVSTGSDGDGSYIWINWNRDQTAWTWTRAWIWTNTVPVFNQGTSLTIKARIKFNSFAVNNVWWIFWSTADFAMNIESSTNKIRYTVRWSTNVNVDTASALSLSTPYDLYLVYDNSNTKFYAYISSAWWASTLVNAWWTTWPTTFSTDAWQLWDWAIWWWNSSSQSMYIYHAAIRNKALTQAEIDADIALWNTAKNDPSIVAYYIPDNLTYNTQYIASPKALDQSPRSYTWATVTANTDVAPDGTTTADNIVFWAATHRLVQQTITAVTWSSLASKTFIIKAFVKCTAATQTFRFRMDHAWVDTNQYSSDITATTTWQEFTFTRTLTSSTSGTWLFCAVANNAGWTAQTIQVRNVRLFLVNETLRDESPNIWWFIWWKTPLVMSARVKPWVDAADTTSSQVIIKAPRHYLHLRSSTNIVYRRSETTLQARIAWNAWTAILWTWNRNKVNIVAYKYRDWTGWLYETYVNGVKTTGTTSAYSTTIRPASTIYTTQLLVWKDSTAVYYAWDIRDIRAYTFTWLFTDADALAIYNGGEPTSSGITKYLHYKPPVGEVWTTTQDQSTNDRDWTLNGWVTRDYI